MNSPIDAAKLQIAGEEYIKEFESTENKVRAFCSNCGSPLYSARKGLPGIKRLRLGSVQTSFACLNRYHIFTASKAPWYSITDDFPQFDEHKNV